MLVKNDKEQAFLATNCRAENVTSDGNIFDGKLADVSVVKGFNEDHIIRDGVGIYHPFRSRQMEKLHYQQYGGGIRVVGKDRNIKIWDVKDVLHALQNGCEDNYFYWSIKYSNNGNKYELITLCRYINFSRTGAAEEYIQPISGRTMYNDGKRFYISYVVANITTDGKVNAEILNRVPVYIFDTKKAISGRSVKLLGALFSPLKKWFMTDEFCHRIKIDAEISFFTYV